jgi:tRNA nucleotidyltransferase (CCA-adding enzyme)
MKVYLVGGAVRDQLLNLPIKERDWVVVGASPEQLLEKKFRQVGRDFPVFLHPDTNEEYALARTERKSAPGYYGFTCDFSTSVTLEEDLARRDLTINAMAQDEQGNIIDPYNGRYDLEQKILRHVSPAFVEDPVRVLRLARFAARYYYLGFRVADETRSLMYSMVQQNELSHLVAERVWQELQRTLEEKNPEQFIMTLRSCDALRIIFPELHALFGVPNPYHYHHEVDSGVHMLMVLQGAVALTEDPVTRFAALVHDLGKAESPMKNWPSHHGHEEAGVPIIEALCERLRIPNEYRVLATMVSRYHLLIHRLSELRAETIVKILEKTDAFRRAELFYNMLLACKADAEGAGRKVNYRQSSLWGYLLTECAKVNAQDIIAQGYEGAAIKQELHRRRVACVELILNSWKTNEKQS